MEVVQINLNHCELANDLLKQAIIEEKYDVALIAEPYRVPIKDGSWVTDKSGSAAIHVCGRFPIQEIISNEHEGFAVVKINGVYICGCYAPPRWTYEE